MFFTLFGYWVGGGGSPKGLVHNLLMQFFTLDSSKMKVFETDFFDIVITQNDHPRYVKHVLGLIAYFSPHSSIRSGGGGLPWNWYTTYLCLDPHYHYSPLSYLRSSCISCGPSRQRPGTSQHIGVGGVLGHPPGALTHCGNRLGSPLCEPPWISIV